MAKESATKKIEKSRKPRIHISYDVETGNAKEKKELPFVVGTMGDYSGNAPTTEKKALKDRNFVEIDADNFDDVMSKVGAGARARVENVLDDEGKEMQVELAFNKMEDFEPMNIAKQVPALQKLLEARQQLDEILSKADLSQNLEEILEKVLNNNDDLKAMVDALGPTDKAPADKAADTEENK
jgi:type VI secretion system protein ImpB